MLTQPELIPQTARPEREAVASGQLRERLAEIEAAGGVVESMERKPGSAVWTITCNWAGNLHSATPLGRIAAGQRPLTLSARNRAPRANAGGMAGILGDKQTISLNQPKVAPGSSFLTSRVKSGFSFLSCDIRNKPLI